MFAELLPFLKDRTLMLIIAGISDRTLRVNVIPQRRPDKQEDTAETALTCPLTVTGTAEELDREFAKQISGFRASWDRLQSNLGEIESAHAAAVKTIEEEKKKELNNKKRASSPTVNAAARNDSEAAPVAANEKPVFGSKIASVAGPTTQSLFDTEPGTDQPAAHSPTPC